MTLQRLPRYRSNPDEWRLVKSLTSLYKGRTLWCASSWSVWRLILLSTYKLHQIYFEKKPYFIIRHHRLKSLLIRKSRINNLNRDKESATIMISALTQKSLIKGRSATTNNSIRSSSRKLLDSKRSQTQSRYHSNKPTTWVRPRTPKKSFLAKILMTSDIKLLN